MQNDITVVAFRGMSCDRSCDRSCDIEVTENCYVAKYHVISLKVWSLI